MMIWATDYINYEVKNGNELISNTNFFSPASLPNIKLSHFGTNYEMFVPTGFFNTCFRTSS